MSSIAWNCRKVIIMGNWYEPQPKQKPKRLPRRLPKKVIPSGIGDEGIVGNWLMYYLKGGDHLHDFSPKDNHGDIKGASWKDGRYGWALEFDGTDDEVDMGDIDAIDGLSECTMAGWVKANALNTDSALFGKAEVGRGNEPILRGLW